MESVFELSNSERANYLLNLMRSFSSSYIFLWKYSVINNFLYCEDGYCNHQTLAQVGAPSYLLPSLAQRLFEEYKAFVFTIENDLNANSLVPGVAFKNRNPYVELHEIDLQRFASIPPQREFYREARIKIAVFLGCEKGEIELGMSQIPQMNLEMRMQAQFPQDFTRQQLQSSLMIAPITEPNRPSPSSSASIDSPSSSSLLYIIPGLSQHQLHNIHLPTLPDPTDVALTRAYLAILSSSTHLPPFSSGEQPSSTLPQEYQRSSTAFRKYSGHNLEARAGKIRLNLRRQTMFKRAITYYRGLNYWKLEASLPIESTRATSTQLHHMIAERRRRENINESFQGLRSLLPQGTKKDKASVLRATKEYLGSLQAQLQSLSNTNQLLEARLLSATPNCHVEQVARPLQIPTFYNGQTFSVSTMPVVSESSSSNGERMVDLQILVLRGEQKPTEDLIIRVLEFLNQVREARLVSLEAQAKDQQGGGNQNATNLINLRIRIEGLEWDESSFKEAITRIIADFIQ